MRYSASIHTQYFVGACVFSRQIRLAVRGQRPLTMLQIAAHRTARFLNRAYADLADLVLYLCKVCSFWNMSLESVMCMFCHKPFLPSMRIKVCKHTQEKGLHQEQHSCQSAQDHTKPISPIYHGWLKAATNIT